MKKVMVLILLVLVLGTVLVACDNNSSSSQGNTSNSVSVPQTQSNTGSGEGENTAVSGSNSAVEGSSEVGAKLIPPNAEVITESPGAVTLTSSNSIEDIKAFYTDALNELGAEEITNTEVIGWEYTGTYEGNKSISITVMDADGDGTFDIMIQY